MSDSQRVLRILAPLAVVLGALLVASCGGGSTSIAPGVLGAPPAPAISVASFSNQANVAFGSSVALPGGGGNGGTVNFGSGAPNGATISESMSSGALDTGTVPNLQGVAREPLGLRAAQSSSITVLFYFRLISSANATFPNAPGLTLVLPPSEVVGGVSYYLAQFDPLRASLGWQKAFEGPATITQGVVLNFAPPSPAVPFTMDSGVPEYFALYAISATAPTPSPAPTATLAPRSVSTTIPAANPGPTFSASIGGYTMAGNLSGTQTGPTYTLSAYLGAAPGVPLGGLPANADVFLTLGLSATSTVNNVNGDTSHVVVTLPSTFSAGGVQVYYVGCQQAACPYAAGSPVPATITNGTITIAQGGPNLPQITSTTNYVLFYTVPVATPAPSGAATTIPANASSNISIGTGGYTLAGTIPSFNTSGTLTLTATAGLPAGVSLSAPGNASVFFTLSVTASTTIPNSNTNPTLTLTVPPSFSTAGVTVYEVGCVNTACPYPSSSPVALTVTNGIITVNTTVNVPPPSATTTNEFVFYTVPGTVTPTPTASATATPSTAASPTVTETIVPSPQASTGQSVTVSSGGYTSTLYFGGFTGASSAQLTATTGTGLPNGFTTSTILSSTFCGTSGCQTPTPLAYLTLTTNTAITFTNSNCNGCYYQTPNSTITIPQSVASTLGSQVTLYMEECVGTTCDPNPYDVIAISPNLSGTTITLPNDAFEDLSSLSSTPTAFVLFTLNTGGTTNSSGNSTGTFGGSVGNIVFPTLGGVVNGKGNVMNATLTFSPAPASSAAITLNAYNQLSAAVTAIATSIPTNPPSSQPSPGPSATPNVVAVYTLSVNNTLTTTHPPAMALTGFPITPAGAFYWTYFADVTAGQSFGYGGASPCNSCSVSTPTYQLALPFFGNTGMINNAAGAGSGQTLTAGHTYVFEIVTF